MSKEFNFTDMNERYGYFNLELENPELIQAVSLAEAENVQQYKPGCRTISKDVYCGSEKEEFVTLDYDEQRYLKKYLGLLNSGKSNISFEKINPQHYQINVVNASTDTAILVKMTHDKDFTAEINNEEVDIEQIGPDFMLIIPEKEGDYTINLRYNMSNLIIIGAVISVVSFFILIFISVFPQKKSFLKNKFLNFHKGDY
ncbi:MAG: hypothetical protein ACOC1P_00705 [Minisyncoccales bacterium]